MARHALLDRPAPATAAETTAVLSGLPTVVRWPTVDPDEAAADARRALRQRRQPTMGLLERVLAGLRAL